MILYSNNNSGFQDEIQQWKWLDGRLYSTPVESSISIHPLIRVHCTGERQCTQTNLDNTSVIFHDQGKCKALLTREGFFDFRVLPTLCNVSHGVAVVCQQDAKGNLAFTSNMSDIKISLVDGFHSIQVFSSCDPGWFMVDDVCINFYLCPNCKNNIEAHEVCSMFGGQLAYHVLKNVSINTPRNKLDKSTKLSLFWDMFHHMEDLSPFVRESFTLEYFTLQKQQKYLAVNGSALCVAWNNSNECKKDNIVLSVGYYNIRLSPVYSHEYSCCSACACYDRLPMWSVIYQPIFELAEYKNLSLCEMSVAHSPVVTNCSEFYMSCNEGTCIHDSLVCDGVSHCPHGEDEADCQHICSDHSQNCTSHCHHRDLCSCLPGYFQCLSGGCVPLQKLCDKNVHCIDKSDEPPTCVYLRPEQLRRPFVDIRYKQLHQYINTAKYDQTASMLTIQ